MVPYFSQRMGGFLMEALDEEDTAAVALPLLMLYSKSIGDYSEMLEKANEFLSDTENQVSVSAIHSIEIIWQSLNDEEQQECFQKIKSLYDESECMDDASVPFLNAAGLFLSQLAGQ